MILLLDSWHPLHVRISQLIREKIVAEQKGFQLNREGKISEADQQFDVAQTCHDEIAALKKKLGL